RSPHGERILPSKRSPTAGHAADRKTGENKTLEISSSEENGRDANLDLQTGRITRKLTRRSHSATLCESLAIDPKSKMQDARVESA
ncbi:MAG: hypothetical protein ACREUG_12270, partial [Steroidobacteraceae bacterium]